MTYCLRATTLTLAALAGLVAALVILDASQIGGVTVWDWMRVALIGVTTAWLAWGALQAYLGLKPRPAPAPFVARANHAPTVVLLPICNENPDAVFQNVAAMHASFREAGLELDIAILSDTRDSTALALERAAFARLRQVADTRRIYYRNRRDNRGRKAGNIEHFITHSGAAYEFAVILDADSLIEGATVARLIERMEADPELGLLQTLPVILGARSLFGRAMQFASAFHSPVFARGLTRLQGRTGPFWGHNAIVRVRALAESCGLPELSGPPPFGGVILSHDYVEAALLARAGWKVEVDERLGGSYEGGPENLIAFARRDRRWCQGNLQYLRLVAAPDLCGWSRFVFVQGIFAYLASVCWGLFLLATILAAINPGVVDYFPEEQQLFPSLPEDQTLSLIALTIGVVTLLILPKLAIFAEGTLTRRVVGFGGGVRAFASLLGEIALSVVTAPILLMFQVRSVGEVLLRRDGGWPPSERSAGELDWRTAVSTCGWIVATGVLLLLAVLIAAPSLFWWMLPVAVPMIAAPVTVVLTSRAAPRVFATPAEWGEATILTHVRAAQQAWAAPGPETREGARPYHVAA